MTLSDLLDQLYARLNYSATPPTAVTQRLIDALNESQRRILRTPGLGNAVAATTAGLTLTSVVGQAVYGLPSALARVRLITDTTNDRIILPMTLRELRGGDPGLDATGTPTRFVGLGYKPYKAAPRTTGLWAASTSAIDAAGPSIQINGVLADGTATGDISTSLTGVTRVALGSATTYIDLTSISLSAACAGVVTVYSAAVGGIEIATIPIDQWAPHYYCIHLWPMPDAVTSYTIDGSLRPLLLEDSSDVPQVPEEFHDLVLYGALVIEYEKQDDPRIGLAQGLYKEAMSALKYAIGSQASLPVFGRGGAVPQSRLGAWTPTD